MFAQRGRSLKYIHVHTYIHTYIQTLHPFNWPVWGSLRLCVQLDMPTIHVDYLMGNKADSHNTKYTGQRKRWASISTGHSLMAWCTYSGNETLQTSYTTLTPYSNGSRDFHTYMTSEFYI